MIARISGTLVESAFTGCVVDVGGVGYDVQLPLSTFDQLPLPGNPVTLWIHTQVREDAITLYGFISQEERKLFRLLLNVSGIGGKLALNVLSAMPVQNFCSAVESGDVRALSRISGIGKRTAERLVVELKGKFSGDPALSGVASPVDGAASDAALALEQLGFKRDAVNKTVNALMTELPPEKRTVEELVRAALLRLNF